MATLHQKRSRRQERQAAADIDGTPQPGSGAPAHYKGDVRNADEGLRGECKSTTALSFALKLRELEKIQAEALMGGAEGWFMQVEYARPGSLVRRYAVIDWFEYLQYQALKKAVKKHRLDMWGESGPVEHPADGELYQQAGVV